MVCCALAGCKGGDAADAGPTEPRPARSIVSDDGLATLYVPDGGAPASAAITVTARHDGGFIRYELQPSGLKLDPPGWLMIASNAATARDAGVVSVPATLISDDGTKEPTVSLTGTRSGTAGRQRAYSVVKVKHFSQVVLGQDPTVPALPYLRLDGASLGGFVRDFQQTWTEHVDVVHENLSQFLTRYEGRYVVTVAGAVDLVAPAAGEIPGSGMMPGALDFQVKCARAGWATITLTFVSGLNQQELAHTYAGACNVVPLARALGVPAVSVMPPVVSEYAALVAALGPLLIDPDAEEELTEAEIEAVLAAPEVWAFFGGLPDLSDDTPNGSVDFAVECDHCELDVAKLARATFTSRNPEGIIPFGFHLWAGGALQPDDRSLAAGAPLPNVTTSTVTLPYTCARPGLGVLWLQAELLRVDTGAVWAVEPFYTLIFCLSGLQGDAIMLSDNSRASRSGGAWSLAAPGVTANVIHASPAVEAKFAPVSPQAIAYGGVASFTSNAGLTPLLLKSARQTGTATFSNGRYALGGLTAGAAYDVTGTFTVEHVASATSVSVAAPPPLAATVLGAPAGWDTPLSFDDGTFDTLYVFVTLTAPAGAPAGELGLMRFARAADLPLAAGKRTSPLLDAETKAALLGSGFGFGAIYVATYNTASSAAFFPSLRPLPVQAGRMVQLSAADLGL